MDAPPRDAQSKRTLQPAKAEGSDHRQSALDALDSLEDHVRWSNPADPRVAEEMCDLIALIRVRLENSLG
jgi:hypothetical protein